MKKITIIIPCFNEEDVLTIFYDELIENIDMNYQYNFIFVDDGSKDNTLKIIKELNKKDNRVKYISLSRNFGKESAMYAGLEAAKKLESDAAIIMDADLQDPPNLIPEMLKYYEEGYQHIYAKHRTRKGDPLLKSFFAKCFYRIYAFLTGDKNLAQGSRDYCLLEKNVIDAFLAIEDNDRFTKGIFSWVGFDKKCIEYDYIPRAAGKTKWSFIKLFKYALSGIRQFSHFYLLVPSVAIIITLGFLIYDIVYGILNSISYLAIKIDLFALLILITLRFLIRLLYDVRDQGLKRPMYLTKKSNIGTDDEKINQ